MLREFEHGVVANALESLDLVLVLSVSCLFEQGIARLDDRNEEVCRRGLLTHGITDLAERDARRRSRLLMLCPLRPFAMQVHPSVGGAL